MNSINIKIYSKFEKKSFAFCYLMILIPVANFLVFWLYVNFSSISLAFLDTNGSLTLDNFRTVFHAVTDADMFGINLWQSLLRSLLVWFLSYFVCFPIGIITTYVLFRQIRFHYFFRLCYIIPGLMGAVIWTSLIKFMVAYDGPVTQMLLDLGVKLPKGAIRNGLFGAEETAFKTLCVIQVLFGLVGNNAVLTGAFARVPDEIYESAELDGADFWTCFFKIILPCVSSTITTLMTFSLCGILTADNGVYLYSNGTGQPGMSTIGFQLYNLTYQLSLGGGSLSYGYPAALGFILTVITLPIVIFGRKLIEKIMPNVEL